MSLFSFAYQNGGLFLSRGCGQHAVRTISTYEVILVVSGKLDMFEEDKNYHLTAGDYLLLRRGRKHGGLAAYPGTLKFYWHHFLPVTVEADDFLEKLPSMHSVYWKESVLELSAKILFEQQFKAECPAKQMLLDALFSGLLTELMAEPEEKFRKRNPLAEKTRNYFQLHYGEAVTTSDAAKMLGCSPDYLGRIFFQEYAHTIGDELRMLRIGQAKKLLKMLQMPLKETAELCGYRDLSYFHRQFFRETGMTPGAWQKKSGIGHVNTD